MPRPPRTPADAGPQNPSRRRGLFGAALGGTALLGCAGTPPVVPPFNSQAGGRAEQDLARLMAGLAPRCGLAPTETEGPFPLRAALAGDRLLRTDITEGLPGVPLALRIRLVDVNTGCRPITGAWVYLWHCDRDGRYSGYQDMASPAQPDETFLRGIQKSDADGCVTFTTVYPGWYEGRITHIHCMVFLAGSRLSSSSASMATTQFAFPDATTAAVYASPLYGKGPNTSVTRLEDDGVFADGAGSEMLTLTGSVAAGFTAGIVVGVDRTVSNPSFADGPPPGRPPGPPSGGPDGPRPPPMGWGQPPRGNPPPRGRGGPQ